MPQKRLFEVANSVIDADKRTQASQQQQSAKYAKHQTKI